MTLSSKPEPTEFPVKKKWMTHFESGDMVSFAQGKSLNSLNLVTWFIMLIFTVILWNKTKAENMCCFFHHRKYNLLVSFFLKLHI